MKLAVFGLGYVGCVSAACFADLGHEVIGVDINPSKVAQINSGHAPIIEPLLSDRLARQVKDGRLRAAVDVREAMAGAEVVFICVGTPSSENGALDYQHLREVAEQLSACLPLASPNVVVAIRSTVMADVVLEEVVPRLEKHGGRAGRDFGVCLNPEFLREGTAVSDFMAPSLTLIGEMDESSGARLAAVYDAIEAPIVRVDIRTAGLVKYASNAFHALKVVFANEFGVLCERAGADSRQVMDVFCRDTKLNISTAYLRPGFAFGGSCLPKDLRALLHRARHTDADLPVFNSILRSNELHVGRAVEAIRRSGSSNVGVVGLSFKTATDNLRESPLVSLVEQLIGRGFRVRVYDPEVILSRLFGGNREYIDRTIPHITALMEESLPSLVANSDLIVVGKAADGLDAALQEPKPGQLVLDLIRRWDRQLARVSGRTILRIC